MRSLDATTDHSRGRSPRRRSDPRRLPRSRRCAIGLAVLAATLSAPASALAADPPTILTAGINAADELYATWTVAPGTTFDFITFATVPDPDPSQPSFFAEGNFAGFCGSDSTSATCTPTSYVAGYPVGRDRRYYAKVSAKVDGTTNTYLQSVVWVVDDAKPQIAGAAASGATTPTNKPVAGHPLGGAAVPPPVAPPPVAPVTPRGAMKLLTPPKTLAGLRRRGVRLQVGCTVTCGTFARLTLAGRTLGTKTLDITGAGTGTLTVKPSAAGRRRLRGRSRARIKLTAAVAPFGGMTTTLTKSFTVRR